MTGVLLTSAAQAQYTNTGTITGAPVSTGYGILAEDLAGVSWNVTNASTGVILTSGLYAVGVILPGGNFYNAGYISADGDKGAGVSMGGDGGVVLNKGVIGANGTGIVLGGSGDVAINAGTIQAASGIVALGRATISNEMTDSGSAGTISGYGAVGVNLQGGGDITNGASGALAEDIDGPVGVMIHDLSGRSTVTNFGNILGGSSQAGLSAGIYVDGFAKIINGDVKSPRATISGSYAAPGIEALGGTVEVDNYGIVAASNAPAVSLAAGAFTNADNATGAGSVQGAHGGVYIGEGTVTNRGVIAAATGVGVRLGAGVVDNFGRIDGAIYGVELQSPGTVVNTGTILAPTNVGVKLDEGGTVINTGVIGGAEALTIASGTLVNKGTITGNGGYAVRFLDGGNRMVLEPSGQVTGAISAPQSPANVLELAPTLGITPGTLTGLGSTIAGFQKVEVDTGGRWVIEGSQAPINTEFDLDAQSLLTISGVVADVGSLALSSTTSKGGSVDVTGGLTMQTLYINGGDTLAVGPSAIVEVGSGQDFSSGVVSVSGDGAIVGSGTIAASVIDAGGVYSSAGALTVSGSLTGSGSALVGYKSSLVVDGALTLTGGVGFNAGSKQTLSLGAPAACTTTISGFAKGDHIDLIHEVATAVTFSGGTLTITGSGGSVLASLKFTGSYVSGNFAFGTDHAQGTLITYSPTPAAAVNQFVAAMAGMGAGGAGSALESDATSTPAVPPILGRPRVEAR